MSAREPVCAIDIGTGGSTDGKVTGFCKSIFAIEVSVGETVGTINIGIRGAIDRLSIRGRVCGRFIRGRSVGVRITILPRSVALAWRHDVEVKEGA